MIIDPWSSMDVKDYGKLRDEFGIRPFAPLLKKIKNPGLLMRRGVIFGHRDFDRVLEAAAKGKPWAMMTGLMPSGKFHLGHAILAQQIIEYQKMGGQIFLCVADIEAYNVRKMSFEELRSIAIDEYLVNYIALGLTPKCDFYFQSDRTVPYYRLASSLARRVTFNEIKALYGEVDPAKIYSSLIQSADILHPQLKEYGGPKPVFVPCGVDQDPHIRLTRDLASRSSEEFGFIPPGSTYHVFMKGLSGGKMSSSNPSSYIALTDTPEEARKKIARAFSGGGATLKEHREKGGNPDVDVACQYLTFMFEPDDRKLAEKISGFRKGDIHSGELKGYLADKVEAFLKEHQKKRELAKKRVEQFLK
jgi:tryptophanyl-tRNA synthetase